MSIEIDIKKFPEYPEISSLITDILDHNKHLESRITYLESVLSEIQMLNALGKTLKISQAIQSAIETK